MKSTMEFRLKVTWPGSRPSLHRKKSLKQAHTDAAKYESDPLGRTAEVQAREVTATPWRTQTP